MAGIVLLDHMGKGLAAVSNTGTPRTQTGRAMGIIGLNGKTQCDGIAGGACHASQELELLQPTVLHVPAKRQGFQTAGRARCFDNAIGGIGGKSGLDQGLFWRLFAQQGCPGLIQDYRVF